MAKRRWMAPALVLSGVLAACSGDAPQGERDAGTRTWDSTLRQELLSMAAADQEVREGFGPDALGDTAFMGRMARTDSAHTRRLRELVDSLGWPEADAVGSEGLEAAFLLVQHAADPAFRARMLPRVEEDVRAGHLDPQDYALLVDRVRQQEGRLQLYGTQLSMDAGDEGLRLDPIEDSAGVDARRAALGLPPLATYLDLVEEQTGVDVIGHEPAADTTGGVQG